MFRTCDQDPSVPAFGRLRQEDWKFGANLDQLQMRPFLNKTKREFLPKAINRVRDTECSIDFWEVIWSG